MDSFNKRHAAIAAAVLLALGAVACSETEQTAGGTTTVIKPAEQTASGPVVLTPADQVATATTGTPASTTDESSGPVLLTPTDSSTTTVTTVTTTTTERVAAAPAPTPTDPMGKDAAITAAVKAELAKDPGLSTQNIEVATSGSVVTLTGQVDEASKIDRAKFLAQSVEGIADVNNEIVATG